MRARKNPLIPLLNKEKKGLFLKKQRDKFKYILNKILPT
jgi:hypothetical protein